LRADFRKLFDLGLMTVTPDYRVQVSKRIHEHWFDGKVYYRLQARSSPRFLRIRATSHGPPRLARRKRVREAERICSVRRRSRPYWPFVASATGSSSTHPGTWRLQFQSKRQSSWSTSSGRATRVLTLGQRRPHVCSQSWPRSAHG
jgi:hypothetical protein